jgi:hypothetical protein
VPNTTGTTARPLQLADEAEDAVVTVVVDMSAVVVVCIQLDDMHAHHALVARLLDVPGLHKSQLHSRRN